MTADFTKAARIIDEHRVISTAFGTTREGRGGRWATCLCGHESASYYDEQVVPIDGEHNPEREVQRKHAAHVAQVLAAQEPTDAEVEAAKAVLDSVEYADEPQSIRAALSAARAVRNGESHE